MKAGFATSSDRRLLFLLAREGLRPRWAPPRGRAGPCRDNGCFPTPRPSTPGQKETPAGRSPFAGIARIRSLGVAVQPLSCPRPLSLSSRLRSPRHSVRSSSLDHLADMLTLHGADDGRLESKARSARAKRLVSWGAGEPGRPAPAGVAAEPADPADCPAGLSLRP